jgi:hypothetical protein
MRTVLLAGRIGSLRKFLTNYKLIFIPFWHFQQAPDHMEWYINFLHRTGRYIFRLEKKDLTLGGILGSTVTSAIWKLSQNAAPNEQFSS